MSCSWCWPSSRPAAHLLICDPERVRARAADLVATSEEFLAASWAAAAGGGKAPVDLGSASLRSLEEVAEVAGQLGLPWWSLSPFSTDNELAVRTGTSAVTSSFEAAPSYRGDTEALLGDIAGWHRAGWRIALVFDGHGTAERALERLRGVGHRGPAGSRASTS